MEMNFQIVSDGSCDLPQDIVQQAGISVVPFYVSFDGKNYRREGREMGVRAFYEEMIARPGVYPKSSMPTAQDFAETFEPLVKAGVPILCICITTKFSGSMQSAMLAKQMMLEKHPDAQITVIDSTVNTVLQGIYVLEAVRLQQSGATYQAAAARLLEIRASGRIFFTIGSMDYLQKGGRIGKLAGKVATILQVRPMIVLREGEIFPAGIARSRKSSMEKVIALLQSYLEETKRPAGDFSICIGYGYSRDEAEAFRLQIMQRVHLTQEQVPLYQIGATIAVHTGPYPIGVAIVEKAL